MLSCMLCTSTIIMNQGKKRSILVLKAVNSGIASIRRASVVNTRPPTLAIAGTTVKDYLDEKQFSYKEGHTSYILECPICDKAVKQENGAPQYCAYMNKTTGSVICQPCQVLGSWSDFDTWTQNKTQPPTNRELMHSLNAAEKFWSKTLPWKMSVATVMNKAMKLFGCNQITSETLEKFDVRTVAGKEMDEQCLAYPFSNGRNIVRVKVESITEQPHKKEYFEPRQGLHGLFGWNLIKDSDKQVVLTDNEFDAMAVSQVTQIPALALPNGCLHLPTELIPQLEQFEKIIFWLGNDPQSKQSRQSFNNYVKDLNMKRCYTVSQGDINVKSAVHALDEGCDLNRIIQSPKLVAHNQLKIFEEERSDVCHDFINPEQGAGVKWQRYPGLNKILKGHRPGELTILTGPSGSGKTTLISELSLDLCQQGVTTLWGSFEVKTRRLMKVMMRQVSGINFEKSSAKLSYWADQFHQLPLYFMNFYGSTDIETVIEVMTHAADIHSVDHVVIDNLQFMQGSALSVDGKYLLQEKAIAEFRKFSASRNVHVSIVMHPRKEDNHVELQESSIAGTAKASQEADNIFILQKLPKQPKYLQVAKNRFDGDLGRIVLEYDKISQTFSGHFKKYINMQHKEEEEGTGIPSIVEAPSVTTTSNSELKKPTAGAVNKLPALQKIKPFWTVRRTKKAL